jgi:hypothetical protein
MDFFQTSSVFFINVKKNAIMGTTLIKYKKNAAQSGEDCTAGRFYLG